MKIIAYTLWFVLVIMTLGICMLAALVLCEPMDSRLLKIGVFLGLVWMAADLCHTVLMVPWKIQAVTRDT